MTPYRKRMNPFIQRMVEDMQLRNLAPATIDAYTYHVDKFCRHFNKMADELGPEEIRELQLYLVHEKKVSWSAFNQAVCGLRFLYEVTLQRPTFLSSISAPSQLQLPMPETHTRVPNTHTRVPKRQPFVPKLPCFVRQSAGLGPFLASRIRSPGPDFCPKQPVFSTKRRFFGSGWPVLGRIVCVFRSGVAGWRRCGLVSRLLSPPTPGDYRRDEDGGRAGLRSRAARPEICFAG